MRTIRIIIAALALAACKDPCTAKNASKTICSTDAGVTTCTYRCNRPWTKSSSEE